jgi:hypothetical protein
MIFTRSRLGPAAAVCLAVAALFLFPSFGAAAEKTRIVADDYAIDAQVDPGTHHLRANARIHLIATDDTNFAAFELHNALRVIKVTDGNGKPLNAERISQENSIRIALPETFRKGESRVLNIEYEGSLQNADDSPVPGVKLAYIGDDESYLLYAGRWFPIVGYGVNRFTATIHVTVPKGVTVIGSGRSSKLENAIVAQPTAAASGGRRGAKNEAKNEPKPEPPRSDAAHTVYTFVWDKPSFPGTIIIGNFVESHSNPGGVDVNVFFKPNHKELEEAYAETAGKEFQYFSLIYGAAPSPVLNVVELPDDSVPYAWAPEIAAIASHSISKKTEYRLLADAIAHQWWGVNVSPASKADFWITEGLARYSEIRYVQSIAGETGLEEGVKDLSVDALAYDNLPLSGVGKLDAFSPEFQSLVTGKGAMIFHMMRWVEGEAAFDKTMRALTTQFAGKPVSTDDVAKVANQQSGQNLSGFFTQWLDSTGAPEFKDKYTIYRTPKGFRIVGEITQDLDLFRMPVELKIDTDGQTEMRRIEVSGTQSPYAVETFGRPRRITIDPNNWVLKNTPDLKVRTAIQRGTFMVQQGDLAEALKQFRIALDANKLSSLAHYRIAEVFFLQHNYQAAANAYRDALNGDGEPKWTEVWSHIRLGNIYDLTGQRERATNEYRQALLTNDNTSGAQDEARKYLSAPYQRERGSNGQ